MTILIHQTTLATAAPVVGRQHRPVIQGEIRPAVGEMTVDHHPHHVALVGTRRAAGAMTAGRHRRHLVLAGMTTDVMRIAVAMVEIVVRPPPRGIVDAATRFRGLRLILVRAPSVSVSVRRPVGKAHENGTVTGLALALHVITTAGEMIRGRDTGNADADTSDHFMDYLLCVDLVYSLICFVTITGVLKYHSQLILPLHHLWPLEFEIHQRSAIASPQS